MGKVAIVTDSNSGITQSEACLLYTSYKAIYNMRTGTIMDASHWFTEAVLIMAALPLGLIFARIFTDKEFRYSI